MSYSTVKTEMTGKTSRRCRRAEAKAGSKKVRRRNDRTAIAKGVMDSNLARTDVKG